MEIALPLNDFIAIKNTHSKKISKRKQALCKNILKNHSL